MENISVDKLYELYVHTINSCGTYLLSSDDSVIGYNIFEEFDIRAVTFLHSDNLQRLHEAGLINDVVRSKSLSLRAKFLRLQQSNEWNINAVRTSYEWKIVLDMADEIKSVISSLR
ncbi:hypothetical protein A8990_1795 [Paenibacillus taihuensis]|uniref:Uncharacterized protein n=1 Tax=Paenibacillus taihuensis TaxID=1156355 RepID=A0A3D9PWJ5_9BACL|nr:hypothetical protein A8990_1795 [Paenibacillus taihuensis]